MYFTTQIFHTATNPPANCQRRRLSFTYPTTGLRQMRHYHAPARVAKSKKTDNTKCWWGDMEQICPIALGGSGNLYNYFTVWWRLPKLNLCIPPGDLAFLLQDTELVKKYTRYVHQKRYKDVLQPKCPSTVRRINTSGYIRTVCNDKLPHTTWITFINIIWSKSHKSQAQSSKPGKLICGVRSQDNGPLGRGAFATRRGHGATEV